MAFKEYLEKGLTALNMATTFTEELVDDMATADVITAKGTDGFHDQMPDIATSPALAVYDNGGIPAHRSPILQRSIGFRARGASYAEAVVLADAVRDRYHQMIDTSLERTRILWATADGEPTSLGRDSANRSLVAFNTTFGTVGIPAQTCNLVATLSNFDWRVSRTAIQVSFDSAPAVRCWTRWRTAPDGDWSTYIVQHTNFPTTHTLHTVATGLAGLTEYDVQIRVRPSGGVSETHPQCGEQVYRVKTALGEEEGVFIGVFDEGEE